MDRPVPSLFIRRILDLDKVLETHMVEPIRTAETIRPLTQVGVKGQLLSIVFPHVIESNPV